MKISTTLAASRLPKWGFFPSPSQKTPHTSTVTIPNEHHHVTGDRKNSPGVVADILIKASKAGDGWMLVYNVVRATPEAMNAGERGGCETSRWAAEWENLKDAGSVSTAPMIVVDLGGPKVMLRWVRDAAGQAAGTIFLHCCRGFMSCNETFTGRSRGIGPAPKLRFLAFWMNRKFENLDRNVGIWEGAREFGN